MFIVLSKTKMHDHISNSKLSFVKYNIFRYDADVLFIVIEVVELMFLLAFENTQFNDKHICVRFNVGLSH